MEGNRAIYRYTSAKQYLLDAVAHAQRDQPGASVRSLAKKMGFASHAGLLFLLQGKRPLRIKHATAVARCFELGAAETIYLKTLIQLDGARDQEERELCLLQLSGLGQGPARTLELGDEFKLISDWLHTALLAMAEIGDRPRAPQEIADRFGGKVTASEVRAAMSRLQQLKLLRVDKDGAWHASTTHSTTRNDVPSEAVRDHYRGVLELARKAIDTAVERREFQSLALAVDPERIGLAKEMIRKFRSDFDRAMSATGGASQATPKKKEVYQLCMQFFQLTESPSRSAG